MAEDAHEGLGLEYLDKLTFFNENFEYAGRLYDYEDVQHVEFTAVRKKNSVNGIPTGTTCRANLTLHLHSGARIRIAQEQGFLGRKQKERSEAVMKAATMFMQLTFEQRVSVYESHLAERGFVHWRRHQIARNGDLFRQNEFRFNLISDDVSLHLDAFQVNCRQKNPGFVTRMQERWSGPSDVIDVSLDRDCFLYILKHHLGLTWASDPAPERKADGRSLFYRSLLMLGGRLCKVDGHVSRDEIAVFKRFFGIDESSFPGAAKLFTEATLSSASVSDTAREIRELLEEREEPMEYILIGLMQIAAADGFIHPSERNFIYTVGHEFGFSPARIGQLFHIFEESRDDQQNRRERANGSSASTGVVAQRYQHLRVLGLEEGATIVEIKSAYRELARKHHPDLLRAQGVPIDAIEHAEEILKVVNAAYEWFLRDDKARKDQNV